MHQLRLALRIAKTRLHAPRLECFAVRARRNLPVLLLAGQPDFEVIALGRRKTDIASAKRHDAIGKVEFLQNDLGVMRQLLQRLVRFLWMDDLNEFDLVELVLPDHAPSVFAVASRFGPEARRMGSEPYRQLVSGDNLVANEIGERDLSRGDQIHARFVGRTTFGHPEQIVLEFS